MTLKTLRTLWPTALALALAACGGGGGGDDDPAPSLYTQQWGTASADAVLAVKADADGNVYAFGVTAGAMPGASSSGGVDLVLTKYHRDGQRLWVRQFGSVGNDEAGGITIDAQGRIIVAGTVQGSVDGATHRGGSDVYVAAYGSDGQRLWARQWGTSGEDIGRAVATAANGDVYVTGKQNGTTLLLLRVAAGGASDGDLSRVSDSSAEGHGIAIVGSSVYLTGRTGASMDGQTYGGGAGDVFLSKRRLSDGATEWTRLLGGPGDEVGRGLAVDASGHVLLTGLTFGTLGNTQALGLGDVFIAKYDDLGTQRWLKRTGSAAEDAGYAIATDAQGNAYVAGHSAGSFGNTTALGNVDMVLLKYDGAGNPLWVRRLGSSAADTAWAVTTAADGSVYIGGQTQGSIDGRAALGLADMILARYDANGNRQ